MEGYLAEIRLFAGNFNPRGWFFCQGQLISIAQNTALFSLLGTTYGGNGQTTFALPDFRGRIGVGTGIGPGLPSIDLGQMSGSPNVTLVSTNLPAHNHQVTGNLNIQANSDGSLSNDPTNRYLGPANSYTSANGDLVNLAPVAISMPTTISGSNTPVPTRNPYLGLNFIICAEGIYPSRN